MVNPYEAPQEDDEAHLSRQAEIRRLHDMAIGLYWFLFAVLGFTLELFMLTACIRIAQTLVKGEGRSAIELTVILIGLIGTIVLLVNFLYGAFRMTRGTFGTLATIASLFLLIIWPFAILFWIITAVRAIILLRRANIKTGLFGPRLSDLPAIEIGESAVNA